MSGENTLTSIGRKIGFFVSFLLFSSILFTILNLLHKLPTYIRYIHVAVGVIVIYIIGLMIKVLKG